MKLPRETKIQLYNVIMEKLAVSVRQHLNELSTQTVKNASDKVKLKSRLLISDNDHNEVDEEKFKEYISKQTNPAYVRRLQKLYDEGTLAKHILRQQHIINTMANSDFEWFREHYDEYKVPLSPEFLEGNGDSYGMKTTKREPTEDEHNFYRFFVSMGTDTDGMKPEDVQRYQKAWRQYYIDTLNIDPLKI